MSWAGHRRFLRVSIAGVPVPTTDEVDVSEALDQLVRTASFVMAAQPDPQPATGDAVLIELVADDLGLVWDLFAGTINSLDVESEPWAYSVLACDQLELLRATNKSGDLDLTGMTDGEAWQAIADYCGVAYDGADIADAGYVLGTREPLAWHDDASTSGAAVIAELDSVFGMATMTVGANRVIRIPVDYTPANDTGLYRAYTKGTDADWAAHHRSRGDRDAIQNVWRVTGASVESADGSCSEVPWAFAVSGNAQIGRRVRPAEQTVSSDFIQDEDLASVIVRRQMRRFNRGPDHASLTLELDANIHPGHKVKLIDHTYGINTGAGRRCLVASVSRSGVQMTAECECGAAGSEGTVTHGVDKVCGDTHSDSDWTTGFTPGDFGYPPLDAGSGIDLSGLWDTPADVWDVGVPDEGCIPPADPETCDSDAWSTGLSVEAGADWEITGTLTLTADTEALTLGLDTDDGFYRFRIAGGAFYDPLVGRFRYELLSPHFSHRLAGYAPIGEAIAWRLLWEDPPKRLTFYAEVGSDICYADVILEPDATMAGAVTWESVTGSPTRADETILHNCTGGGGGGTVVGLVFANDAGDGSVGLASPIADVFSELGIELWNP